jgi:PAS domain S-box-containing protein
METKQASPIRFSDIFSLEEIQALQDSFSEATGVASIITDPDGNPITKPSNFCRLCSTIIRNTEAGRINCYQSDAILGRMSSSGPIVQPCLSGGLWDAGAGIAVDGKNIANWLIGQVRNEDSDEERMLRYADDIGANREEFIAALKEVPVMPLHQFNSVAKVMYAMALQLSEKATCHIRYSQQREEMENDRAARQEVELFNKRIVETTNEGIWAMDANYNTTYINSKMAGMLGYSIEEVMGMKMTEFIFTDDQHDHLRKRAQRMSGKPGLYERRFKKKDGSAVWTIVSSTPILDKDGTFIGSFGMIMDMTVRKDAEQELRELNEKLDQRVMQRTAELEAAIHELETFSYSVSHDLKTPLRHIKGFTGLLLEDKFIGLSGENLAYLKSISRSATEMEHLIDALLSFSRLNQADMRKIVINTSGMVGKVIRFFEPELQNRNIEFIVGKLSDIHGDENLIRQVWTNLISNAIKYSGKREKAVVEIGSTSTDKDTTFFVRDNGVGFNMKYAGKLFGVFHRLHKTEDFEGVGIGLANVRRIVNRHGGHCSIEAEPDKGATFYFTLPH